MAIILALALSACSNRTYYDASGNEISRAEYIQHARAAKQQAQIERAANRHVKFKAAKNSQNLIRLKTGMKVDEVTKIMGSPERTEMLIGKNDQKYLVFFYKTQEQEKKPFFGNRKPDPEPLGIRAMQTPIIFEDEVLGSWGWAMWDQITGTKRETIIRGGRRAGGEL
jgi:outer membrane protein assembly factor BamE (lipoprotein component of BamABCDE complex)